MNILNLLTKEKKVAGIEISDSIVRIVFLREHKEKGKQARGPELILIEEPIASDLIVEGVVTDSALLGKALKAIWAKANLDTDYAIVAIPDDKIYSRIFSFPKTVEGTRLSEAMRLAIGFQLPIKTSDAYLDWERLEGSSHTNEILLATIPRTVARGYAEALEIAGIKTLALESHLASIARAVKLTPASATLFTKKTPDGSTVFMLKDGILRFSRTLPSRFINEEQTLAEIQKIKTALEIELKEVASEMPITEASIRDDYANFASLSEPKAKWLIALGAMIRGQIPGGEDNLVSLLPVGTEEAYAYQKATTFIILIRNMTIGVSVFFAITFLIAYLFMLSLLQSSSQTTSPLPLSMVPLDPLAKEVSIGYMNDLTKTARTLATEAPLWSVVIEEITSRTGDSITISGFSASSLVEKMSITGNAKNRAALSQFKKDLQSSPLLSEVELPLTNLDKRADIPFSVSFMLKDPAAAYYNASK